jgi:hypothetical protein
MLLHLVQHATRDFLLPKLKDELKHIAQPDLLYKILMLDSRDMCGTSGGTAWCCRVIDLDSDICNMGLFLCMWFCRDCGMEVCGLCYSDVIGNHDYVGRNFDSCGSMRHSSNNFIPASYFTSEQVGFHNLFLKATTVIRWSSTVSRKYHRNGRHGDAPRPHTDTCDGG